jgi:poly-gamma-glutamate synthesis protein (capsule biosynthesis protein)
VSLRRHFNPVVSLTLKGKVLNFILRQLFGVVRLFKGKNWERPIPAFEEDPAGFSRRDIVYFGYKYYAFPHWKAENDATEAHFRTQPAQINPPADADHTVTISLGGDLMPYKVLRDADTEGLWDDFREFYFGADIVFANLETPMQFAKSASWVPEVMLNDMYFNGDRQLWDIFTDSGRGRYDVLSIANNHMLDQGYEGLAATAAFLQQEKVAYAGWNQDGIFRAQQQIIERKGIHFGFSAWTYSLNRCKPDPARAEELNYLPLNRLDCDTTRIRNECRQLRENGADVLILSLHAGNAYQAFPGEIVCSNFRKLMEETGADVIVGTHPHNPQPWEFYSWKREDGSEARGLILYSLGDFIAYDIFKWCHLPLMLRLNFTRQESGVILTGFEPRFGFMHLSKRGSLHLLDFATAKDKIDARVDKAAYKEWQELRYFYDRNFSTLISLPSYPIEPFTHPGLPSQ